MKHTLFVITLTILLSIVISNLILAEIVTDGLVSYWTFDKNDIIDNTLKDVWGENNVTIHGNPNTATGIAGEAFKSMAEAIILTSQHSVILESS